MNMMSPSYTKGNWQLIEEKSRAISKYHYVLQLQGKVFYKQLAQKCLRILSKSTLEKKAVVLYSIVLNETCTLLGWKKYFVGFVLKCSPYFRGSMCYRHELVTSQKIPCSFTVKGSFHTQQQNRNKKAGF